VKDLLRLLTLLTISLVTLFAAGLVLWQVATRSERNRLAMLYVEVEEGARLSQADVRLMDLMERDMQTCRARLTSVMRRHDPQH
jgi:hypothetical protein